MFSLLNSSLGKCSQWPDSGLHYKNFLFTLFFLLMQNKDGVEEEGLESMAGFCPTELGLSFFPSWALGKCSSDSNLRVSEEKEDVLYVLPMKDQTICENSSGRSHGARDCDWEFLGHCILNYIMNVKLAFYLYI